SQGGVARPYRMIFVGQWRSKQGHDAIAQHLIHGTLVAVHGRHQAFEDGVEELAGFFGIPVGEELHGALQVGEEHRDLLALAFESALRVEDLLSQMRGRVRAWGTLWFAGWHRSRRRTTDPDQHFAVLVDSQTLGVDEFSLQILEV